MREYKNLEEHDRPSHATSFQGEVLAAAPALACKLVNFLREGQPLLPLGEGWFQSQMGLVAQVEVEES